jgi:hypothetical protein
MKQWLEEIAGIRRNVTVSPADPPVMMVLPPDGTCAWMSSNLATGEGAAPEDLVTGTRDPLAPIKVNVLDARDLLAAQLAELVGEMREVHNLTGPTERGIEHDVKFLLTWIGTLEKHEWVKDWWTTLAETMSACHALAPWRASMQRCHGIPCPECEETNLVIYGGDEDVTCQSCRTMIPPDRYGIWIRIIKDEAESRGIA